MQIHFEMAADHSMQEILTAIKMFAKHGEHIIDADADAAGRHADTATNNSNFSDTSSTKSAASSPNTWSDAEHHGTDIATNSH